MRLAEKDLIYISDIVDEMLKDTSLMKLAGYRQHGSTNCLQHSIAVAAYSYGWAKKMRWECDYQGLVTGALLHDFYLYDWYVSHKEHRFHGFRHPYTAWKNASLERELGKTEENIIKRHMFPLTPIPPACREAWIVNLADKVCAFREFFWKNPYAELKGDLKQVNLDETGRNINAAVHR